jgi:phage terminase small subunit
MEPRSICGRKISCCSFKLRAVSTTETAFGRPMKSVTFAARVAELKDEAARGAVLTTREVLEGLSRLAVSNMQDYVGAHGQLLDMSQLTREHAAALQEVTIDTYMDGAREVKRVKFKLYDKRAALVDLGRHYKLFTDSKTDVNLTVTLEMLIAESYKKDEAVK